MQKCYAIGSRRLLTREAEGVRFELTRPFGLPVFKTGAINRSATPPARPQGGLQPHSYEKDARRYFGISARVSKCDRGLSSPVRRPEIRSFSSRNSPNREVSRP